MDHRRHAGELAAEARTRARDRSAVDGRTEDELPTVGEDTAQEPARRAGQAEPQPRRCCRRRPRRSPLPRRRARARGGRAKGARAHALARCRASSPLRRRRRPGRRRRLLPARRRQRQAGRGQFQPAGAPVELQLPATSSRASRRSGGLLKPTFSTAVGVDAANYVVVATYRISANVQADGSAIGTGGSRLTADRFDESVDRAAERIAAAQKLKAQRASPSRARPAT